ncbi:MAG: long-chain fatty acid--CoA ligase [Thermoproteota archaeon]
MAGEAKISSEEVFRTYIEPRPWTKWYDEYVPKEVKIPEVPLFKFLDDAASRYAERTAFIFFGRKVSYREFKENADRIAKGLAEEFGVGRGDKVAVYLPNTPQFAMAYYGTLKAGAAVVPVNPLYKAGEVARLLVKARPKVVIALDLFAKTLEEAMKVSGHEPAGVIYTGVDDYLPAILAALYRLKERKPKIRYDSKKIWRFKDFVRAHAPSPPQVQVNPKEDLAALMFTGGTTGIPKGVMLTHYNLVSNVIQIDAWWKPGTKGSDVMVGVLPWFHIYGQTAVLNLGVYRAATIIVYPTFDLKRLLRDIEKYKPNIFHGVPTIYSRIVATPGIEKRNLGSIEVCISGAAPLPKAVAERFEQLTGARLREGYGLTETSPVTHVNPIYGRYKIGSIGVPVPNTLAAIADPEKPELLPPGKVGELVISGPQVMKGYYEMDEENKLVFFECCGLRWLRTGDMAYMDEEGYFYIVDRKKDTIKYKGITLFPREIEEVLYKHECVQDAAVVGIPDPYVGERPKAYIVLKPECRGKVTPEDIISYARQHLADFKVPKLVEFRDELPKSAVGKILRRVLREEELKKAQQGGGAG